MRQGTLLGLVIVLIAGCATTDDPRQGGLFSYNPAAYEQRLEERRQNLAALQRDQQAEEQQSRQLESDIKTQQALLEQEQEHLRGLDAELQRLQQNVEKYQGKSKAQQAEKQRLGRDIKRLRGQLSGLRNNQQLAQAEKTKHIESLQREIDELSKVATQLTK